MDESKTGRPKMKEQTRPLIFEKVRSRVTREVSMPAKIGEDLDRYIKWACKEVGADPDEAMTLVMEHALGQFFARDKLFQERGRDDEDRTKGSTPPSTPGAKPAASNGASPPGTGATNSTAGKGAPPSQPSPSTTRPAIPQ
jgi:hypothetical protein